ncbi:VOC family protein [Streptomyces sp. NPDC097617]|uniref:VOC family protein n=1 Tax=Streptomyces sp. NPDC097617 TaxID=3366091 RepID=UPI003822A36F
MQYERQTMLTVLPIRYVADVEASREFYAGLGLAVRQEPGAAVRVRLGAGAGAVGIHAAAVSQGRPPATTELGFTTDEPLEDVARRLERGGHPCEIVEENFGRSVRVTDPEGVVVQIQQIDPDVVGRSAGRQVGSGRSAAAAAAAAAEAAEEALAAEAVSATVAGDRA